MNTTTLAKRTHDAVENGEAVVATLKDKVEDLRAQSLDAWKQARRFAKANPGKVLVTVGALGFLAGWLLRRR